MRAVDLPEGLPIFDGLYSEDQLRRGETPPAIDYDRTEAARLLDEAGWRDRDGDGVRDRDGLPFRFTALFGGGGGGSWSAQGEEAVALLLREAVRPLGIEVELQPLAGSVKRERMMAGDFEVVVEDIVSLPTRVWAFGEDNYLGYDNPRVAALLDRIGSAFSPDSVDAHYRELAEIFAADHPVLFLYPAISTSIVHRRIRGLSPPHRTDPVWYLEDLWIEEEGR
jgi:peptide/nickel transport system substrate-binding protein